MTVTVTNPSSDNLELFELILTLREGLKAEQSFKIRLFINLNSDTAVKLRWRALVWVTIRSKFDDGEVKEAAEAIEELRKKKTNKILGTYLRTQLQDSMKLRRRKGQRKWV